MSFHVIIPARLRSTRLPNKVLLDIGGKSMLQRVYEQVISSGAATVTIATDDFSVYEHARHFTAQVLMTRDNHQSGTDRLAEAAELLALNPEDLVVNVQADEPFIPAQMIDQVAALLAQHPQAVMATLCEPIVHLQDVFNPNIVKVVINEKQEAQYFSRAPIPWYRGVFATNPENISLADLPQQYYRHIGLYAYRVKFLKDYTTWPTAEVEQLEQLEQLRILMKGERIAIEPACMSSPVGVDTEADLLFARELAANLSSRE